MILLDNAIVKLGKHYSLGPLSLALSRGQHAVITGANGSGKSALVAALNQEGELVSGSREISARVVCVGVAQQQAIIEQERKKDSADILDVIPQPSSVMDILGQDKPGLSDDERTELLALARLLNADKLLEREFLALSTGETRKVLLIKAILSKPDVLVLDEPYDGLDTATSAALRDELERLSQHMTLIMVVNRLSEMPDFTSRLLYLQGGTIGWQSQGDTLSDNDKAHLHQLLHMSFTDMALPARDSDHAAPEWDQHDKPLVVLNNGHVQYGDNVVFDGLNWTISPGQHWQIVGPNGSGKTCLLSMITGDNGHCYTNDLHVFGYKRGSGESIWDIKQHLGFISNSLHLQYRVNCSLLQVVLSGFYDSIGLYQQPTTQQKQLAREWLGILALENHADTPFQQLSFGDQRLALIARAMVKHPPLLILDEPCNGLDDVNRMKVLALVEKLAAEGNTTLLYVNHHREDVIKGVERVLDMADYQAS